jgi:hypothetical protein
MVVADAIFELFTTHSDPLGNERPTLMPGADGNLSISFPRRKISKSLDILDGSPASEKIKTRIQETYRKIRARHLERDERDPEREQYKRYLDAKARKLGVSYKELIPDDLPDEGTLPHRTIFTDSFTYDPGDLVTVSAGAWTYKDNSFTVVSGQLASDVDSSAVVFWSTETDDDDVYASIDLIAFSFNKRQGVSLRINPDTGNDDNFYFVTTIQDSLADTMEIRKNINNTVTPISTGDCSCGDVTTGETIYGEISGSDFRLELDGVEELTGSDTDLTGFNTVGIYMGDNDPQQLTDNWEGGDLGGAPAVAEEEKRGMIRIINQD